MDNTTEFNQYTTGIDYNNKLTPPYYQTIDKNYRFYGTDHWRGVKANGNPTPIFPVTKQIVDYKISSLVSSKTKMQFGVENIADDTQDSQEQELQNIANLISGYSQVKWEKLKMDSLIREVLLKGAVTGDMCLYTYWDPTIDTGQTYGIEPNAEQTTLPEDGTTPQDTQNIPQEGMPQPTQAMEPKPVKIMGDFVTEVVPGSNIFFGNPNDRRVQTQPYILIANRDLVSNLKAKAKSNKISKLEIDKIVGDSETQEQSGERGKIELDNKSTDNSKCLYVIKLWKENKKVMMKIVTKSAIIQNATDTGLTLYPIAWANWDLIENSYHGQAEVTGLVPNQILVNQLAANIAIFMKKTAFGKVVYNKERILNWDDRVAGAIGVEGDVTGTVQQLQPGQMNNAILTFFYTVVKMTKDIAGANDSALGNVDPKNTSAIIANQRQAAVPLEAIKDRLYQLIEDLGYIWIDFILNKYELDRKVSYKENDKNMVGTLNGSQYKDVPFKLHIDVGPSTYWSEIASMQTLDNLLQQQKITFVQYLERVSNGMIPKKQELIDEINKQNEQMAAQQKNQQLQMQQNQVTQQNQQAQQAQEQQQQMQSQQQQEQQAKGQQYEAMAKFVESLSKQVQEQLKALPPQEMEKQVLQMMKSNINNSVKNSMNIQGGQQ